ncbi:MAG: hypothetical protein GVY28_11525, partial [Alphaproteobacteria bacterium]|nr:hypothetical protein [Alphaproteobacteria bacterium]
MEAPMSGTRNWQVAVTALVFALICTPLAAQDLGGFQMPGEDDDGPAAGTPPQQPDVSAPATDANASPSRSAANAGQTGRITGARPGEQDADFPQSTPEDVRKKATESFKDFIHYGRLARLDLAAAHGRSFARASVDPQTILQIIEASPYSDSYEDDLARMKNMTSDQAQQVGIAEVAATVAEKIDQARIAVVRNPKRIREEIHKLDDGLRPRLNATRRLKVAGEYAAPYMLQVLTGITDKDKRLHPYVVGRPLVVPLAEAMKTLSPVAQQDVGRVLGRIGYPVALPYLKALAEADRTDEQTAAVLMEAFDQIAQSRAISGELGPAALFLMLAEDYYAGRESLIMEPGADYNVMWYVNDAGRLTYRRIPTAVFGDVMAMRSARRALSYKPSMSAAMSLWVAANFRRENNLPASYGPAMRSPHFYAVLSGPAHIKPALMRALNGGDADLALDLIGALEATAGAGSLIEHADAVVAALNYTDRRVRYDVAHAVGMADPDQAFDGAGRVIPVLAEAVRQGDER